MKIFKKLFQVEEVEHKVTGLTKQLQAVYIYNVFEKRKKSILLVTSSLFEANQLYQMLTNFTSSVSLFPMDEFLTSEALATSPEFMVTRLETLNRLMDNTPQIVVTNLMGYLRFLPKKEQYQDSYIHLEKGKEYNFSEMSEKIGKIGYNRETVVTKTGEVAIRGFVLDIFPISFATPIRIEFWGDEIESIRTFDVETQRTLEEIDKVTITPNTEFLSPNNEDVTIYKQKNLYKYTEVSMISAYMNSPIIVYSDYTSFMSTYELLVEDIQKYKEDVNEDVEQKYMNSLEDVGELEKIYFQNDDNTSISVKNTQKYISHEIDENFGKINSLGGTLNKYLKEGKTVVCCLKNRYQVNRLNELLQEENTVFTNEEEIYDKKINLIVHPLEMGFLYENYVVFSENDLFHDKGKSAKYKTNFQYGSKIKDITKLSIGDYIVHSVHGIGRYNGLKTLVKNGIKKDYLQIEYRDGDKLYIPVEKIDLISKYSSNESIVPKINKLGSTEWEKTKLKVRKKIENIAGKLLELYAKREATVGIKFDKDTEEQAIFESNFPYEETKDQLRVMEEIKGDMENKRPMDRLVCGDVGYGKTELAFRAMFKAVASGYQAAYLCPTTILADQHYQNALQRFAGFPVQIAILNRFVTPKKVKETLQDLEKGTIDIIIGTHRLLSNDVHFHKLGLLVVDEEQRFGVKHKEKIKELKTNIDILTLSATPIPRTLQMSMTGIRSLSLLETPPINRFPIQTYVLEENNAVIKDAIYKELARNGQVFILYNHVEDMDQKQREIERLVPEARVIYAHGRLSKTELETIMKKFIQKEYDVLLCTTIIETGIDIPNVNTLCIMDADRFGLSQLYQIRGRVGRSDKIAYCYLMYTPGKALSDVSNKRLQVIKEFTELGSGFSIAMRDLSIRGAGDILGSEQAGYIDTVGIELYLKMLNEEVDRLHGKVVETEEKDEQPLLNVETAINDEYVTDTDIKIEIHKKINSIDSYDKLVEVKTELEDRFGKISDSLIIYMHEEWFEKLAKKLNIKRVRQTTNFIEIVVPEELVSILDGEKLFLDILSISKMFRFGHQGKQLLITLDIVKLEKHFIYYLIDLMNVLEKCKKKDN